MYLKILALAAIAATAASAIPLAAQKAQPSKTRSSPYASLSPYPQSLRTSANTTSYSPSGKQQVVYWGQKDSERSLGEYCKSGEGIDIIVLAFVAEYSAGSLSGSFGSQCQFGNGAPCSSLEADIASCKQAGKKIYVSVGGATGAGQINSQSDAKSIATELFDSFADPAVAKSGRSRPLGQAFVDGFDFDIESNTGGNQYYPALITKLRTLFASDPKNKYAISGAPQCPIPEPNMGAMIAAAKFDQLFIQFYNNPACSANLYQPGGGASGFNFDQWGGYVAQGMSKGASLFIGLPASPNAATGTASGSRYYVQPPTLQSMLNEYKSHPGFGGVMLWDAGNSDTVNDNGCHYAQEVRSILDTGKTC